MLQERLNPSVAEDTVPIPVTSEPQVEQEIFSALKSSTALEVKYVLCWNVASPFN
jgi:hypothetical protein